MGELYAMCGVESRTILNYFREGILTAKNAENAKDFQGRGAGLDLDLDFGPSPTSRLTARLVWSTGALVSHNFR